MCTQVPGAGSASSVVRHTGDPPAVVSVALHGSNDDSGEKILAAGALPGTHRALAHACSAHDKHTCGTRHRQAVASIWCKLGMPALTRWRYS